MHDVTMVSAFSIPKDSSQISSLPTTPALPSRILKSAHQQSNRPSHGTRSGARAPRAAVSSKAGGVVAERDVGGDGRGGETGLTIRGGKMEVAKDPSR